MNVAPRSPAAIRITAVAGVRVSANAAGPSARTLAIISDEVGHERVVRAAPYCAEAVHESVQPLADGNRIVQRQVTRLCRDGEGRTRQEVEHNGRRRVYLPAGATWTHVETGRRYPGGGWVTVPAPLEQIPLFTRDDADLPLRLEME